MYFCTNQHSSSGLSSSFEGVDLPANWKLFQEGLNFTGAFRLLQFPINETLVTLNGYMELNSESDNEICNGFVKKICDENEICSSDVKKITVDE